ncbi:MAG TPA: KOW domain-containing RNA-binding protein [Bacillota bacterium]|nr:KOW domain-containing RNA-binding protein [Bacillota bacterium]
MITTVDGLRHGQLVRSTAGRDRNQYYLIFRTVGDRFLEVVNGVNHPVVKPKRKNIRHLKIFMIVDRAIEDLILNGEIIRDSVIVSAVKRMVSDYEEGDRFNG